MLKVKILFQDIYNTDATLIQERDALGRKGKKYGLYKNIRLNKYGFNDSDDYDKTKKKHKIRILCLGDSITFGTLTVPYDWPRFLEEILQSKGVDAEVINAAMYGNNYTAIVNRFEAEYLEFKPDIVLINKDCRSYSVPVNFGKKPHKMPLWRRALYKSAIFKKYLEKEPSGICERLLDKRKKMGIKNLVIEITDEHLSRYKKDLERLIQICKKNNITLVLSRSPFAVNEGNKKEFNEAICETLYFAPWLDKDAYIKSISIFNDFTYEIAKNNNVMYIDISKNLGRNKEYFIDCYHLTVKGLKQVAQNYAEVMEELIQKEFRETD